MKPDTPADPAVAADNVVNLPLDRLDALEVTLRFEVGELSLSLGELKGIRAGHVFDLAQPLNRSPVRIVAHGNVLGKGYLVAIGDRLGVRVSEFAPGEVCEAGTKAAHARRDPGAAHPRRGDGCVRLRDLRGADGDQLHEAGDRIRPAAHRARTAADAAEHGAQRHRDHPDGVHHGTGGHGHRRYPAHAQLRHQGREHGRHHGGGRCREGASQGVPAEAYARARTPVLPEVGFQHLAQGACRAAQGRRLHGTGAQLHAERTHTRVPDRFHHLPGVRGGRPDRGHGAACAGHVDDRANHHFAAVQAAAVRDAGRLDATGARAGAVVPLSSHSGVELELRSETHVLFDPWLDSAKVSPVPLVSLERPDYLVLSHIHFDHARDVGAIQKKFPGVRIFSGMLSVEPLAKE